MVCPERGYSMLRGTSASDLVLQSQIQHLPTMQLWASYLHPLSFSCVICEMLAAKLSSLVSWEERVILAVTFGNNDY